VHAFNLYRTSNKRHPTQSAFRTTGGAESRTSVFSIPRHGKLPAYALHCITVQPEFSGGASAELDQVECRWPSNTKVAATTTFGLALDLGAIVPDIVAGARMSSKMFADCRVLQPVPIREYHKELISTVCG
jgi:hypothetical protein